MGWACNYVIWTKLVLERKRVKRLKEQRAVLLEACKAVLAILQATRAGDPCRHLRAAIKEAKGEKA